MALPDINIEQFLDLVEGSKIYPHDNGADIEEKNRKLDMLREQAAAKPFLLNKTGTSSSRHSRKTTPLALAFDRNNGAAARVLLEAGADMRHNFEWISYNGGKKRNAFDAFLDSHHAKRNTISRYVYPHGNSFAGDEILPIIEEYLGGLSPEERRTMFGRSADGKYYVTSLANVQKWPLFDENGDESPSAFEALTKLGATFDIIPPKDRATALTAALQTNLYFGGPGYFRFLKEHMHSLEGGDEVWRSMFEPGQLFTIMYSIHSSRICNSDEHPKKKVENYYALFRAILDEVPDEGLRALFADKVKGNYQVGNRPIGPLVSHIITNRHYGAAKEFSTYLAGRLTTYFDNIYPTLPDDEQLKVDCLCREMFGGFYSCRYANRENNPVYQLLRKRVEDQLAQDKIPDEKYGKPAPRSLPELIIQYSGSHYDEAAVNVQELLTELHRHHFYPSKTVLTPEERDHILDEIAKWDKDLPEAIRGYETENLLMQVSRDYDRKNVVMNAEELAAKRAKNPKLRSELKERNAPYRNGYQSLCNEKNIQFIIEHMGGETGAREHVPFAEAVSFFNEIGFYLGKLNHDLEPLAQKCFEDVVLHAEKQHTSLTEALDFFKTHYPRQEIINVHDTLNELSRYIYQPAYVIRARKAGLSENEISKSLQENSGYVYTIRQSFLDGLAFHEILDNSIYWHMRRAGVIGPAPKDAETGEPITDAVRKHALRVGWNPLFKGDVNFEIGQKHYRLSPAVTSLELQRYGSYCRTCVGGEGFSMDCMAGRQQVYGLYEIDEATGKASQKGYVRMRVTRAIDSKAFEQQLESQEKSGDAATAKRFSDGVGIAINRRTAIQYEYITGFGNQTPPWLQKIFEKGLKEFGRVAIEKGRDGRLTLPQKEKDTDDSVLATPEEILGLDQINHADSLRIFKLLEKTAAGLARNENGYAIDADTGEEIKNLEGLYEGDRKVRIDEDASVFRHFRTNRHTIPGHSKMDGLQQFMAVTRLDKSIDDTIASYKKRKAEKEAKGETEQQQRYGTVGDVSFQAVERHVPNVQDRYYNDIREMQGIINRKLKGYRNRGTEIPQIFGNISVSDVLEAVKAFAEAYPDEAKIEAKPYAPDETKITVRKLGWQDTNLDIILSHIIAKRGVSVPFLEWKAGKDIEFMSEDTRWLKDCKPLSDFDAIGPFVANEIGEAPGMTAFQAEGEGKTFFALRPSSMEDMELAVKFSQNSKTFPALIWGIPAQEGPVEDRAWRGGSRPQWLVTPQFQKELETLGAANFHRIEPPDRVHVKNSPVKIGEDRTLAFERRA